MAKFLFWEISSVEWLGKNDFRQKDSYYTKECGPF